jgi:hypothetical protein
MAFSFKQLKTFATGPQGKKLIAKAKQFDTPENREKAKALVADVRKKAAPAAKAAAKRVRPKPQGGAQSPPA